VTVEDVVVDKRVVDEDDVVVVKRVIEELEDVVVVKLVVEDVEDEVVVKRVVDEVEEVVVDKLVLDEEDVDVLLVGAVLVVVTLATEYNSVNDAAQQLSLVPVTATHVAVYVPAGLPAQLNITLNPDQ
jgi:hypothetical protein